jgi:hypothetical protein
MSEQIADIVLDIPIQMTRQTRRSLLLASLARTGRPRPSEQMWVLRRERELARRRGLRRPGRIG